MKTNARGVFTKPQSIQIARARQGSAYAVLKLATDGEHWYSGYDYRAGDCGGGSFPALHREKFASRDEAAAAAITQVKQSISRSVAGCTKTTQAACSALLKQIGLLGA